MANLAQSIRTAAADLALGLVSRTRTESVGASGATSLLAPPPSMDEVYSRSDH